MADRLEGMGRVQAIAGEAYFGVSRVADSTVFFGAMTLNLADEVLVRRLREKDIAAFRILVDRHGPAVMGACLRILGGNRALAEEITQDVWMKVLDLGASGSYAGSGSFRGWLLAIARNAALTELKRQGRFSRFGLPEESQLPSDGDPEASIGLNAEMEDLKQAIDALPDSQRVALSLWVSEELSYEEIAGRLEASVATVKSLLFRARQSLKKKLEKK